jgi:hypothetical protein
MNKINEIFQIYAFYLLLFYLLIIIIIELFQGLHVNNMFI